MSHFVIYASAKFIALFAYAKIIFIILKLDRFIELFGKPTQTLLKYFFICLISYKVIEVSFGLIEQFELLNTK